MNIDKTADLVVVFQTHDEAPDWPESNSRYDRQAGAQDCFVSRISLNHSPVEVKDSRGETIVQRQLDYWYLFTAIPVRDQQAIDVVDALIDQETLPQDTFQHSEDANAIGLTIDWVLPDHGREVAAAIAVELSEISATTVRIYRVDQLWQ